MQRHNNKKHKEERKKIEEAAKPPSSNLLESDEEVVAKLLAGKTFLKADVEKVCRKIFSSYNYEKQFVLLEKLDDFEEDFKSVDSQEDKPIFVIYGKPKNRWILFAVLRKNGKRTVLYKDPCGAPLQYKLERKLLERFSEFEVIAQTQIDQKEDDEKSYGPLTVRNLKILLDFLKQEPDDFGKFKEITFAHLTELDQTKFKEVAALTLNLSENVEFKAKLKDFIDKLPTDLGDSTTEYRKVMEEELEKGEEKANYQRIEEARRKFQGNLEGFKKNYAVHQKQESDEMKEYTLEIQEKFPDEMKKLGNIFELLDDIKVDEKLWKALENISEVLGVDYGKMKSFYESKAEKEQEEEEDKLTCENISDIVSALPAMKESSADDCTPLKVLLEEVTLGMDKDPPLLDEITKIEEKYNLMKKLYENWKTSDLKTINQWAKEKKGCLGTSNEEICETLAIMDRAYNLMTGGYHLRDTQVLSVLIFFHDVSTKGRLCQIKTGEGKTVIVSLLAVIKALQGSPVDVITSSPLLASDGVDETKTFYSVFNLTVSTNNVDSNSEFKIGYKADILYGTISNFQFDFLKDTFENYTIRCDRQFGQVILDEVDSMLVDNGGHIAKLASPYPGMECLRYIYIKIWQELHKAEESFVQESQNKINQILSQSDRNQAQLEYNKLMEETIFNERKILKEKIRASGPTQVPLIPNHLKEYVASKLETWIQNALHAKYNCHEHEQYRIIENESGEKFVTPVDYLNTGVTMRNTIWSNGLHQFVQLKHNLCLTFESLTSSFISNIGYIKNYEDKKIFGLTGTLGSRAEQELLSQIYNINYAKLPTYKQKQFSELDGRVVVDRTWSHETALEILSKVDEKRAILAVFETEKDLLEVKTNLETLQSEEFRIRAFSNEDDADETKEKVKIGDIILATNIAGRGTNFKTEKSLEENGGLHVLVGFLPCNLRVEGQAFGRTSRQGNKGTAQLLIRHSEVEELGIHDPSPDFLVIKAERDRLEGERLLQINNVLVKELNFKDELFKYFAEFHRKLKQEKTTESYRFVLQDLKEFWAFWLEKKNFKAENIKETTPKQEYDRFLREAKTIIDGEINHNPFYCIAQGDYYLEMEDFEKARSALNRALELGKDPGFLTGAHLKLFELAIASGDQQKKRFVKALAAVFFISVNDNAEYRQKAVQHLQLALVSIRKEIDYIIQHLEVAENEDFRRILIEGEGNLFLKHIYSRLSCLQVHEGNIANLLEVANAAQAGIDFGGKAPTDLSTFDCLDSGMMKILSHSEISELQAIGVDTLYALREVHDIPKEVVLGAIGQIVGGITALAIGLGFPPSFPWMSQIAGTAISEGIMDIVMEVINKGNSEFDKDYMKGKFTSYGVTLITLGFSAVTQSVKILSKAVAYCRKFSNFLSKATHLKGLCTKLAGFVDRMGDVLEKMLQVAKFNKLSKVEQLDELSKLQKSGSQFEHLGGLDKLKELEGLQQAGKLKDLTKTQLFVNFTKETSLSVAKHIGKSIFEENVVKPLLDRVTGGIMEKIGEQLKSDLQLSIRNNKDVVQKLLTTPSETTKEVVEQFIEGNETLNVVKDIEFKFLEKMNSTTVEVLTMGYEFTEKFAKFKIYVANFTSYLDEHLPGGACENNVDEVIEEITSDLTEKLLEILVDQFKTLKDGVKMGLEE